MQKTITCPKRHFRRDVTRDAARDLLHGLADDPMREGLRDTPDRMAAAWEHWTSGYAHDPLSILKTFEDGAEGADEMVFQTAIPLFSLCEHHLCPFFGLAHVAYVPNTRVVGLSKLARLVDIFARRLQVQERLTAQIADTLMEGLRPLGVGVTLQCRHLCMESRGVQKIGTVTTTNALRGVMKEGEPRTEYLQMVTASMNGVKSL